MSAACYLDDFKAVADDLENREQRRHGLNRAEARERVARRLGWSPGTLYNLARDRLKSLDRDLREQLAAYAAQDLEAEIARLTARLEEVRRLRNPEDPKLAGQVEAVLASARKLHAAMNRDAA